MNKLEKTEAFLKDLGVTWHVEEHNGGKTLIVDDNASSEVSGYPAYFVEFNFTKEGDFVDMM